MPFRRVGLVARILVMLGAMVFLPPATAAEWPAGVVTIINPYEPGGAVDVVARELARGLGQELGNDFIVDNRAGAGGTIGAARLAHAKPDGYTLMVHNLGLAISASLYNKLPYDSVRDLVPVAYIGTSSNVLIVNPQVAAKSVGELVALAKAHPGTLNYGSAGVGSSSQIAMALFASTAGIQMAHIPYKGSGPAMIGLVSGQTQVMLQTTPAAIPLINSGQVRALATSGTRRSPALPTVPTIAEAGLKGFEFAPWFGVFAPAQTPPAILDRLHGAVEKVLKDPALVARFAQLDLDVGAMSRDDFARLYDADVARWAEATRTLGIQPR